MTKKALITGITGQDGSYLAELLLRKGYQVIGLSRAEELAVSSKISHLQHSIELAKGDLLDIDSLIATIRRYQPDEIYNLASQSHPGESWNLAIETGKVNALGAHRLFEAVRLEDPGCRIYQASSSEMFGNISNAPQSENTPFNPINPYAAAKIYAHHMAELYRKNYNMFISMGILFNHESPRRGMHYITQKVTYGAACIKLGIQDSPVLNERGEPIVKNGKLALGNLDAKRDWGYAGDYVEAMWLMLQQEKPDDFVIGTGQIRTVRELCEEAFSSVGLNWQEYVVIDPSLIRPIEMFSVVADARKAKELLGWSSQTSFTQVISMMIQANIEQLSGK